MRFIWKLFKKLLRWSIAIFLTTSVLGVVAYRFLPVEFTPLMLIRSIGQILDGEMPTCHHEWIPLDEMPPSLPVAVMASEDTRFLIHHGFDMKAIKSAAEYNKNNPDKPRRGASTITQQTAKNVFLWPDRTWVRKGLECYFTILIEIMWPKQRIMEVYLNSIEMGNGIYGVSSVAEYHFNKKASELTRSDCALIAATLPKPREYSSKNPSIYMKKRQKKIEHEMQFIPVFPKRGEKIDKTTVSGGIYSK